MGSISTIIKGFLQHNCRRQKIKLKTNYQERIVCNRMKSRKWNYLTFISVLP